MRFLEAARSEAARAQAASFVNQSNVAYWHL
jgi:hypothetical protein